MPTKELQLSQHMDFCPPRDFFSFFNHTVIGVEENGKKLQIISGTLKFLKQKLV